MKSKVLINATNLHTGGGVQVASSFISEIVALENKDLDLYILASDDVADNLLKLGISFKGPLKISVFNTWGAKAFFSNLNKELAEFEVVFTIFGPNYLRKKGYFDLVGFAQPWILDSSVYHILSATRRLTLSIKFNLQRLFFKKSDALVVELDHVRDRLRRGRTQFSGPIYVAHNCVSSVFFDRSLWQPINLDNVNGEFKIGFLGRDYPHKNTRIIPAIKNILRSDYDIDADFFVTLNESEWRKKPDYFKKNVSNIGSLSVAQCPTFFESMDAIIFPSLLECFSATPLEAMVMEKPLFASDRQFVKDICGELVFYFNPYDPYDAAKTIASYIQSDFCKDQNRLAVAKEHAINFSSSRGRAEKYLEIIRGVLERS